MGWIGAAIDVHVGAGAIWTVASWAVAVTRRSPRWLLGLQTIAAVVAVLAGIVLWHALHAGPFGPVERRLVVGTVCAFLAFGLQLGIVAPLMLGGGSRLEGAALWLFRASALLLGVAAAAMVASTTA